MRKLILTLTYLLVILSVFAQSPEKMNYQAVARDLSGLPLVSATVNLQFDILQGSTTGVVEYSETQSKTTNQFGLFTAEIGAGSIVIGDFSTIGWGSNAYFLRITVNGDIMPATQLLSVPYALYSKTSGGAGVGLTPGSGIDITGGVITSTSDTSATNELQTLSVNGGGTPEIVLSNGGNAVKFIGAGSTVLSTSSNEITINSAGDNWGTDSVNVSGNNISGSGKVGNPLIVIDNDTSLTNELQNLTWNTTDSNIINLNNGTGIQLASNTPTSNQVLMWNGANWTAQSIGGNRLRDADGDTEINVEATIDQDIIHFSLGNSTGYPGAEYFTMIGPRLEVINSANSIFIGDDAGLNDNLNFGSNVFVGKNVGKGTAPNNNQRNVGVGVESLFLNASDRNTAVGYYTLREATTGGTNSAFGDNAGRQVSTGASNTAIGFGALNNVTTGSWNTGLGIDAGNIAATGDDNVFIGRSASTTSSTVANTIAVGANSKVNQNNSIAFGYNAVANNFGSVAIGNNAIADQNNAIILGQDLAAVKIGMGTNTPTQKLDVVGTAEIDSLRINNSYSFPINAGATGDVLSLFGSDLMWQTPPPIPPSIWAKTGTGIHQATLTDNVGIGTSTPGAELHVVGHIWQVLPGNSTFIGYQAGANDNLAAFNQNTFVGARAGITNVSGTNNTAIGYNAGAAGLVAEHNTAIGAVALSSATGVKNTAIGSAAMINTLGGSHNVSLGWNSLYNNSSGNNNAAIGSLAGLTNTAGSNNTFLGYGADATVNNLTNATAIGYNATVTQSNTLILGNGANVGIGLTPTARLHSSGTLRLENLGGTAPTAGTVLTAVDANGNAQWQAPAVAKWGGPAGVIYPITLTDKVGIGVIAPSSKLHVKDANTNVNASQLTIEANSSFGAQSFAAIEFRGNANAAGVGPTGRIKSFYVNPGYTSATMTFQTIAGGAAFVDVMSLTDGKVGIGTTTPSAKLDVNGTVSINGNTTINGAAVIAGATSLANTLTVSGNSTFNNPITIADGTEGAGKVLTSDASGKGSWVLPPKIAFFAGNDAGTNMAIPLAPANITYGTSSPRYFNIGSHLNPATGVFTAPIAGVYHFTANTHCVGPTSNYVVLTLRVNNVTVIDWKQNILAGGNRHNPHVSGTVHLNTGDTVDITIDGDLSGGNIEGVSTSFSGHLVYAD